MVFDFLFRVLVPFEVVTHNRGQCYVLSDKPSKKTKCFIFDFNLFQDVSLSESKNFQARKFMMHTQIRSFFPDRTMSTLKSESEIKTSGFGI